MTSDREQREQPQRAGVSSGRVPTQRGPVVPEHRRGVAAHHKLFLLFFRTRITHTQCIKHETTQLKLSSTLGEPTCTTRCTQDTTNCPQIMCPGIFLLDQQVPGALNTGSVQTTHRRITRGSQDPRKMMVQEEICREALFGDTLCCPYVQIGLKGIES